MEYYINKTLAVTCFSLFFITGAILLRAQSNPSLQSDTADPVLLPDSITTEIINWEKQKHSFSSDGIYYEYIGVSKSGVKSYNRRISHPELILGYMLGKGIPVREAWYKSYSSNCSPPGSKMAMSVIVPAKLVIRTSTPVDSTLFRSAGLTRRSSPSMGSCPYGIKHYQLFESAK